MDTHNNNIKVEGGMGKVKRHEATRSSSFGGSALSQKDARGNRRAPEGPPARDVLFRQAANSPRRLPVNDYKPVPVVPVTPSFITTYRSRTHRRQLINPIVPLTRPVNESLIGRGMTRATETGTTVKGETIAAS